jgi:hypothetical protein
MFLSREAIEEFDIPPFLLPIYQACGTQYNIPWQILASINRIETNFGRNLNVSSAGARGWMQFMPGTWEAYGVDANRDGKRDPYNPVDAICAAARYLQASGFTKDVRQAIFAYNRADWYVRDVLRGAEKYYRMPLELISAVSTLAAAPFAPAEGNFRRQKRKGIEGVFFSKADFARAATDSRVLRSGVSRKFGRFVVLRDSSGNRYLYAGLRGKLPKAFSAKLNPRSKQVSPGSKKKRPASRQGTVLAGENIAKAKGFFFALRPAGKKSPWVRPGPFLRGWSILEQSAFASLLQKKELRPSIAQILLLSRPRLQGLVLRDRNLQISDCDKNYIRRGLIDRRVLSLLAYLSRADFRLSISSMLCGRESSITVSGGRSYHSFGQAVDIAAIDGQSVLGNQGPGSKAEALVRRVMELQGPMRPQELISLFDFGPPSWSDPAGHDDHVHVGYSSYDKGASGEIVGFLQWKEITDRLEEIPLPEVGLRRSIRGRVSYFGGQGDEQEVAGGGRSGRPGVALNLLPGSDSGWNNSRTQRWMRWAREGRPMMVLVRTQGKRAILPVIDLGPAGWTDRAIDITEAGIRAMGFARGEFRTDAPGTVTLLGRARKK